jgi:hypothetical protein
MPSSCMWLRSGKLGWFECGVVGGIYSPNHQTSRWGGGCLSNGAPDSPVYTGHVRCDSHVTRPLGFRPLELWRWALLDDRWCTGHELWSVRCASMGEPDLCARWRAFNALAGSRWRRSSRCSAVTPDSPVYTRHVRWIIAEQPMRIPETGKFGAASSWSTGHCPVNYSALAPRIP